MAFLPPPPTSNDPSDPSFRDWFYKLQQYLANVGNILFSTLNFTGSNITSIETRHHNDLQEIQGGTTDERYHLTLDQYTPFTGATDGQLLIGNGDGFNLSTLTAGDNISITNGAGSITIASTGGGGDQNIDGGTASSIYTAPQVVDGGSASG
jgi:hypothetical protein